MLNKEIMDRWQQWVSSPIFDNEIKQELKNLSEEEIYDRFYCNLEFGTSGIRGIMGAGTNRMNVYLVRRLSYSLGQAITSGLFEKGEVSFLGTIVQGDKTVSPAERGVVIAYDSRKYSDRFALEAALALAAQGIRTYLFDSLRPTPELSFAVRHLGAAAGVMITASHNPKEYNGYKVYGQDGAQIDPEQAAVITEILNSCPWNVPRISIQEAISRGLLEYIGEKIDDDYQQCIQTEMLRPQLTCEHGQELSIVYTPLHGTGYIPVSRILAHMGFSCVIPVREQMQLDTEFSTVPVPNPEDPEAWNIALKYGEEHKADLILATDPDADRLGVQCRLSDGSYYHFTGNQVGILMTNYILETLQCNGQLPDDGVIIQNTVSTAFTSKLACEYGVEQRIVPVGFKFIGEQIKKMETTGNGTFLFGFEESIGYLKGTYTRDKDAVLAAALVAEAALFYKVRFGKNLYQVLQELFEKHGCFLDQQVSIKFEGAAGKEKIRKILRTLEEDSKSLIGSQRVVRRYRDGKMVCIELEHGGFIKGRPSGTEPKVRLYFCIGSNNGECAHVELEQIKNEILELINKV